METTLTAPETTPRTPSFADALAAFVAATNETIALNTKTHFSNLTPEVLTAVKGRVYTKIVRTCNHGGRSVFCFVRNADGAILKAAGWKAPAKHARGSIYVNNGRDAVGPYGANYL